MLAVICRRWTQDRENYRPEQSFISIANHLYNPQMIFRREVLSLIFVLSLLNGMSFGQKPKPSPVPPPKVLLPEETAGIDEIARTLISAFDQADVVALGEWHGRTSLDSDLRVAMVRNPQFAKKVRAIVVEFASTTEQATLDRYIRGENVSKTQLEQVWKTTTQASNGIWDQPIYADFFAAVRDVNSRLPANGQIRVYGGDPGPGDNRSRETAAIAVLREQVLQKHGKALMIYGAAHFYRTMPEEYLASLGDDIGIARKLEIDLPGRTFVVIPVGNELSTILKDFGMWISLKQLTRRQSKQARIPRPNPKRQRRVHRLLTPQLPPNPTLIPRTARNSNRTSSQIRHFSPT